jgi:hypothetical protein
METGASQSHEGCVDPRLGIKRLDAKHQSERGRPAQMAARTSHL